ncbi:hypothetical protein AB0K35_28425 [Micromonospora sp. NPDC053740]|uniref:hypothetical protein n=1 Tax=Micromonospora sp. NPDC053740 TaxID=3155173 RepID=UPI0034492AD3
MTAAVQWINPGAVGFVAGGVLIVCAVALLWLLFTGRRAKAEAVAEVRPTPAPVPPRWHPSQGPRREQATVLFARCADEPDATVLIPQQRAVRRG